MEKEYYKRIVEKFSSDGVKFSVSADGRGMPLIELNGADKKVLTNLFSFCKEDEALQLDFFENLICVDTNQDFFLIYQLYSTRLSQLVNIRVSVERYSPKIMSASKFWKSAYVFEQEISEMFGIVFEDSVRSLTKGHFFLPDNWIGFPLRKDYVFPENFEGIEHRRAPIRKEHKGWG